MDDNSFPNQEVADCIYEIVGDSIRFYGEASLEYFDKTHPQGIREVILSFIDFELFLPYIQRLKTKLPDVKKIQFEYSNIDNLNQINALDFIGLELEELNISPKGNPIISFNFFRNYTEFRLQHLKLKILNNVIVSESHPAPLFLFTTPTCCEIPVNPGGLEYLDYCTGNISESYPKQLKEANKITKQSVTNAIKNKNRDEWFYDLWSEIFIECIRDNLREMQDLDRFASDYLSH